MTALPDGVALAQHATSEPADPFHAGADHAALNNPMSFKTDSALFTLIVFLMLLAVLWIFAWKPIMAGLEKREHHIAAQITEAKRAAEEAAATLRDYHEKLAVAQAQAQELVAQARKDAETSGQRILAEARADAVRQRERAMADIESAKQAALADIASKSTDIAFSLARQVVGRELKADDHKQLIQDALKHMPSKN